MKEKEKTILVEVRDWYGQEPLTSVKVHIAPDRNPWMTERQLKRLCTICANRPVVTWQKELEECQLIDVFDENGHFRDWVYVR